MCILGTNLEDNFPWRINHFVKKVLTTANISLRAQGHLALDAYLYFGQGGKERSEHLDVFPLRMIREESILGERLVFIIL